MAIPIAQRNITYQISTRSDNRGINQTRLGLSRLSDLAQQVGKDFDNSFQRQEQVLNDLTSSVDGLTISLEDLVATLNERGGSGNGFFNSFFGNLAANAITNLTGRVQELGANTVRLAIDAEQTSVAFETFLGSAQRATQVISELEDFSRVTPFEPEPVIQTGRQLLALGISTENLIPTLTNLGNAAAGTNTDLQDLAFVYGQIRTQQTAYTQDLNQFAARGIPIFELLAEQFGVASSDIKKLAADGQIGFEQIERAFASMSTEGGKFFGLMEAQSQTTGGRISTLQGNFSALQKELGQRLLPTVSNVVDGLANIVEFVRGNINTITILGKTVVVAASAWGGYRLALLATSAAKAVLAVRIKQITDGLRLLAFAIRSNPIGLIGSVVAAAAASLLLFRRRTREVNEELSVQDERLNNVRLSLDKEKASVDALFTSLRDDSTSREEKSVIIDKINSQYGEYLPSLLTERSSLEEIEAAQRAVNSELLRNIILKNQEQELSQIREAEVESFNESRKRLEELIKEREREGAISQRTISDINTFIELRQREGQGIRLTREEEERLAQARRTVQLLPFSDTVQRVAGSQAFLADITRNIKNEYEELAQALGLSDEQMTKANATTVEATDLAKQQAEVTKLLEQEISNSVDASIEDFERLQAFINEERENSRLPSDDSAESEAIARRQKMLELDFAKEILLITQHRNNRLAIEGTTEQQRRLIFAESQREILQAELKFFEAQLDNIDLTAIEYNAILQQITDKTLEFADASGEISDLTAANWQEIANSIEEATRRVAGALNEYVAQAQQAADREVQIQQDRVNRLTQNYSEGTAEQLQIEEERLNELVSKRERFAQLQRQIAAVEIATSNAIAAAKAVEGIAEAFASPAGIVLGIAKSIALAATIASTVATVRGAFGSIPSFFEGEEYFNPSVSAHHGTDSHGRWGLARLHEGERVVDAENNAAIGALSNEDLAYYAKVGQLAVAAPPQPLMLREDLVQAVIASNGNNGGLDALMAELEIMTMKLDKLIRVNKGIGINLNLPTKALTKAMQQEIDKERRNKLRRS